MISSNTSPDDPSGGFAYAGDHQTALRQFRVSLCVVLVLGVAILTAALNMQVWPAHDRTTIILSLMTIQAKPATGSADRS